MLCETDLCRATIINFYHDKVGTESIASLVLLFIFCCSTYSNRCPVCGAYLGTGNQWIRDNP